MSRILILITLTIAFETFAQKPFQKIDTYIAELEKQDAFSGVILIARDGKTLFSKTTGYADRENSVRIDLDSQFNLSSTSKLFTGTSILKLVQEGKIELDDKIGKYIPELEYGNKITIHQLLTHSSGVTDFHDSEGFSYTKIKTCQDVVPFIKAQKPKFEPGDSVYYSTSGMLLLGAVIEKVSEMSYKDYVTKNILVPLDMKHTSFVNYAAASEFAGAPSTYAMGYQKDDSNQIIRSPVRQSDKEFVPLSAGGVWTSASDLARFDAGIHGYKILKKEFVDLMTKQYTFTGWSECYFGYVWITINSGKNEAVGHAGNSRAHHNSFYHYKKDGIVIIALTNYGFVDIFEVAGNIERLMYN